MLIDRTERRYPELLAVISIDNRRLTEGSDEADSGKAPGNKATWGPLQTVAADLRIPSTLSPNGNGYPPRSESFMVSWLKPGRLKLSEKPFDDEKARIRDMNDFFRASGIDGKTLATQGVQELSPPDQAAIFAKIRLFDDFNTSNDPYGEHDFGSIEHNGHKTLFKIDFYDQDLKNHSENPADPIKAKRVMTVMLACDY